MSAGQHPTFITTKVLLPRNAPGLIDRPRLLALLGQVKEKQLVVIKAGAGFGKTSLAITWAERLQQSGSLVAWVSLDADDDEPTRFLFYLAHALRRARDRLGDTAIGLISDISLVPVTTIFSSLVNGSPISRTKSICFWMTII